MPKYILKRIGQSGIVLLGITLVVFIVMNLTGDPLDFILPPGTSVEVYEQYKKELGYDQPLAIQYIQFLGNVLHGDFGQSHFYKQLALKVVLERLPATLQLALPALVLSILFGIPLGTIAAAQRGKPFDVFVRFIALLGQCVPIFWMSMILILIFGVKLRWLPSFGKGTFSHLILPVIALSAYSTASIMRLLRSGMIDTLGRNILSLPAQKGSIIFLL
jgi:peptide/nickel transport system permease protein